jgi:hypothetical protein
MIRSPYRPKKGGGAALDSQPIRARSHVRILVFACDCLLYCGRLVACIQIARPVHRRHRRKEEAEGDEELTQIADGGAKVCGLQQLAGCAAYFSSIVVQGACQ